MIDRDVLFDKEIIKSLDNRVDFLEKSLALVLMNPNLYELLQRLFLLEISKPSKPNTGKNVFETLKTSENWEALTGPQEVEDSTIAELTQTVYKKIEHYRKHGNLNL